MQKRWVWIGAGTLVAVMAIGSLVAVQTGFARRAVGYLDRRYQWTEAGKQAAFDQLWLEAARQYRTAGGDGWTYAKQIDYPVKAELLRAPDRVVQKLRDLLAEDGPSPFLTDLLLSLEPGQGKPLLQPLLDRARCIATPAMTGALRGLYSQAELEELALGHPAGECRRAAWEALPHTSDDPAFLRALVETYRDTQSPWYLAQHPPYQELAMRYYAQLSTPARLQLLQAAGWPGSRILAPGDSLTNWLARETDPAVRQALLQKLGDTPALVGAIERDGYQVGVSMYWQWERDVAARYPDSFLARGIRAYEAVRGVPYFEWDRERRWEYGNRYYNPDREIPGWVAYLAEYARHGGADDAAYRLGRSYEIKGDYAKALTWLNAAQRLPEGEMAPAARARIAWILDAHLTEAELATLRLPELQVAIDYSLAVRKLRTGRYAEAVAALDPLLAAGGPAPLPETGGLAFWPGVKTQREKAARLQTLAADTSAEGRYALAAAFYHDEMLFYNYLWGGGRAGYFYHSGSGGHAMQALMGDMDARYTRWMSEMNNYIQAANAFAALESAPGAVGEKAAYTRAISLVYLTRGYGWDVALWRPRAEIAQEASALLERFVAQHPKSDLADDALLSLGYHKRDASYWQRLLREYPKSDAAPAARSATLKDLPPDGFYPSLPFRYLTLAEAPPAVAAWAQTLVAAGGSGTFRHEGATYVLATTSKPGQVGDLSIGGDYSVRYSWRPDPRGQSYLLARVYTEQAIRVQGGN